MKSIEILQNFLLSKTKIDTEDYLEILGLLMIYSTVTLVREREDLKENLRYGDLTKKQYDIEYNSQKDRFKELFK